jgi:heat shock protein HslJ
MLDKSNSINKNEMKQLLLLSCCLLLISGVSFSSLKRSGRGYTQQQKTKSDTLTLAGDWYLRPVLPSDTAAGKLPMLRFEPRTGKFLGSTGCNQMSGSFSTKGDQLSFDKNINTTKLACEGYNEKEFLSNMLRVDRFKIKDSSTLQLLIGQTPVSEWSRKPYVQKTM